jgi:hypothetical protein
MCSPPSGDQVRRRRRRETDGLGNSARRAILIAEDLTPSRFLEAESSGFELGRAVGFPEPTPPMRTVSPSADRPRKAQEFGRFSWVAVHLGLAPKARNHSLTPGFLCGRSLDPFGTHFAFAKRISDLADRWPTPSLQFLLAGRDTGPKPITFPFHQVDRKRPVQD